MFQCHKLEKRSQKPQVKNCMRFVELTQMKCPKIKALNFSVKKFCKYDSTKKFEGPNKQRLNVVPQQSFLMDKGWYSEEPFFTNTDNYKHYVKLEQKSKWIESYLNKQNKKTLGKKKEFKLKIKKMQSFFEEINDKYQLKGQSKKILMEKLSKIRMERQNSQKNLSHQKLQKNNINSERCSQFQQMTSDLHKTKEKFENIKAYQTDQQYQEPWLFKKSIKLKTHIERNLKQQTISQ